MRDKLSFYSVCGSMIFIIFIAWAYQGNHNSPVESEDPVNSGEASYAETRTISREDSAEDSQVIAADGTAEKKTEENFFLYNVNGFVVVYKSDRKTPYEYTSIECDMLPEKIQTEMKNGKFIKNIGELYSFLENYSS